MENKKMKTVILIDSSADKLSELQEFYNVFRANSADEGLKLIQSNIETASLIIIDIKIFLNDIGNSIKEICGAHDSVKMPVAVITSQQSSENDKLSCLDMDADGFICRSDDIRIIKKQLDGFIQLFDTAGIFERVSKDPLSGAYTKPFFMEYMSQIIRKNPDNEYDLVCLEMESYDLLQGRYGAKLCSNFMSTMVRSLAAFISPDVILGRIDEAHVTFLMPHVPFELHAKMMMDCIKMSENSPFPFFVINAGVSKADRSLSPDDIYNNCLLAIEGIRFRYDRFIAEYDEPIMQKQKRMKVIEQNMYSALSEKQFQVYYQPKYDMHGGKIYGAEALVRWTHPELGFMNPGDFIPLFEGNGFIFELDKYMLEAVCADIRKWLDRGDSIVPVSVNISQTDFDQVNIDSIFEEIADKYNVPHKYIHFELTETADAPDAVKKSIAVSGLRERGFEVELDDFGTGFSTLSILKSMPVDVMKIDMSLIRNIFDPHCRAILEGALFTAMKLKIKVVVEGVETDEQYKALMELCEGNENIYIQGYYFSKPVPSYSFEEKLSEKQNQ